MINKLHNLKSFSDFIGILYLILALIAVSFAAIFIRFSEVELGPIATVFNRLWIATIAFHFWNKLQINYDQEAQFLSKKINHYTNRDRLLLLLCGIVSSASVVFWAWSLTQTSVANSTVIRNLTPVFTSLLGWWLLKQKFDRRFLSGMIVAIIGAILIGLSDLHIAPENFLGDLIALLSALFYAINLLIIEQLIIKFKAGIILFWRCLIGATLLLPLALFTEHDLFPYSWQTWLAVISLAVISQGLGQGLLAHSLKKFSSGFVAVFLLLEPIISATLAWLIFSENLTIFNSFAFSLVLLGIFLAKSSKSAKKVK